MSRIVTLLLLLWSSSVLAGQREDAIAETRQGTTEYNLGHYAEATQHYEKAYRLSNEPILLFNLGQCHRQQGKLDEALAAYRSYLRTAGANPPHEESVRKRIEELERAMAEKRQSEPAPATAAPETAPPPPAPLPAAAPPTTFTQPATIVLAQPTRADEPRPAIYARWWFWTAAAAVVGAGVTAAILLGGGVEDPIMGKQGSVVIR